MEKLSSSSLQKISGGTMNLITNIFISVIEIFKLKKWIGGNLCKN